MIHKGLFTQGILEREVQQEMMDLTNARTGEFITIDGLTVQIRVDPVEKSFSISELKDDPD